MAARPFDVSLCRVSQNLVVFVLLLTLFFFFFQRSSSALLISSETAEKEEEDLELLREENITRIKMTEEFDLYKETSLKITLLCQVTGSYSNAIFLPFSFNLEISDSDISPTT